MNCHLSNPNDLTFFHAFPLFLNAYVKRTHWLYCSASLKVQEKLFNFKTKVQEPTFQMKYQQKEIVMLSS